MAIRANFPKVQPNNSTKEGKEGKEGRELREIRAPYLPVEGQERLLVPVDDEAVWQVVRELFGLDIANLTPVQALVLLNELQRQLRGET